MRGPGSPDAEAAAVALFTGPGLDALVAGVLRGHDSGNDDAGRGGEHSGPAGEPSGAGPARWTLRRVHHRPGASVTAVVDVAARAGRPGGTLCLSTAAPPPWPATVRRADHDDLGLITWWLPHDPWLPGLPLASSPEAVGREVFGSAVPAALVPQSYRPTRRAVLRAVHEGDVRFLKVLRRGRAAALHGRHRLLRDAGLPVPAPDGEPVDDVVVLHALAGTPLAAAVRADGAAALAPEHVLALLGALPPAVLELPARPSWTDRVLDHARAAAVALPEEAARVRDLAHAVDAARRATDPGPLVPTHGDLYEANLLVDPAVRGPFGPVTGLLDVDAAGPGRRADDLGCFVAHLAVLPTVDRRYRHSPAAAERFLAGFDAAVDPAALRVRAAGVVLSLVAGARRTGGPPDRALRRLELAEQFLARAG
ncbi:aminoglycoside phosphotransferase family protein [Kocuria flava]|uniref:aminoglycoside phosphotransferase family protein n=1 Tax=Kocuria flava TaxID=446860 RepID=UPI002F948E22